jgi:cytochrome c oxidase subunit 2
MLRVGSAKEGRIADLWWGLFGISVVVWAIITFLVLWAVARRRGPDVQPRKGGVPAVVVGGIVLPAVILSAAFAASLWVLDLNRSPSTRPVLTMEVIGHDWWWEARYPHFTTANEIHIPVGQSVEIKLRTDDVIHSFWVPSLSPKVDLIPSKQNHIWLQAKKPGVYRGQCAEFCGVEHAGMAFIVVAQPPGAFKRWLAAMSRPAAAPTTALQARGRHVFLSTSCASCHTIAGTSAHGQLGPPLTHFGSRRILGAGVAPNDFGNLTGWIANSQTLKPGNLMPPQPLPPADLIAVANYLEGLK